MLMPRKVNHRKHQRGRTKGVAKGGTNLTFGEYGIQALEDLVRAKLTLARAIDARGLLVLNADDVPLRAAAGALAVPTGWFSLDESAAFLRERAPTRPACVARAGHLWLHPQGITAAGIDLGDIAAMPLSMGGAARYNIANLAAAALAGFALGIDIETIRATLASFGADNADNRGRLERWEWRGVRVWIDYAHNPERLGGRSRDRGAQRRGARHHRIHLFARARVVGQRKPARPAAFRRHARVFGQSRPRPQRKGHAAALEEGNAFDLPDRTPPAQPFEEGRAGREIAHAQRDEADALLHVSLRSTAPSRPCLSG